jgi:predicted amidohydrolase YtcJ
VGSRPDWLAVEGTKIFSDGAMSTRTAAMRRAYLGDPDNHGILLWPRETLANMMHRAHAAGWQIATHALGDRAVEVVLDCYAEAMRGETAHTRRHRIEHCMVCDEELGRRIRDLGIVPVLQPDIFRLGDGYVTALGSERAEEVIPMRVFTSLGIQVALSSDAPVVPCDPLLNIRSAVERVTPGGVALGRHHSIPLIDAIRFYTAGGAHATHTDSERGRLRRGYLADFAVLSHDPATLAEEDLAELHVTMTVVGGRTSYEK